MAADEEDRTGTSTAPKGLLHRVPFFGLGVNNTLVWPGDGSPARVQGESFEEAPRDQQDLSQAGLGPTAQPGNDVDLFLNGRQAFEAMARAIRATDPRRDTDFIYLLAWWLQDDLPLFENDPSSTVFNLFNFACNQRPPNPNVQVRAMLWHQNSSGWPGLALPQTVPILGLRVGHNGAEVNHINGMCNGGAILDGRTLEAGSHHQKVLVVRAGDDLVAFCGGVDINPDRVNQVKAGRPMHDVHCSIRGPAAFDLLQVFIQRWQAHPEATAIDSAKGVLRGLTQGRPTAVLNKHNWVEIGVTRHVITSYHQVPTRLPSVPGIGSTMDVPTSTYTVKSIIGRSVRQARQFIYMENQYIVDMEMADLLFSVLPNIQHLTILIPEAAISDLPQVWHRTKAFVNRIQSDPATKSKARVFYLSGQGWGTYIHSKVYIIDDEIAIIGSANCNRRGCEHDSEVVAAIAQAPDNPTAWTFAHCLRASLWGMHLHKTMSDMQDPHANVGLWLSPPKGSLVTPYDPNADTDTLGTDPVLWNGLFDPDVPLYVTNQPPRY